jgi:hypothetical protein
MLYTYLAYGERFYQLVNLIFILPGAKTKTDTFTPFASFETELDNSVAQSSKTPFFLFSK